jgi:hypothetical protein
VLETVAIGGCKSFTVEATSAETEEPRERRFACPFIGLPEVLLLVDIDRGSDEWSSGKCECAYGSIGGECECECECE